jgi:hypothetical protein
MFHCNTIVHSLLSLLFSHLSLNWIGNWLATLTTDSLMDCTDSWLTALITSHLLLHCLNWTRKYIAIQFNWPGLMITLPFHRHVTLQEISHDCACNCSLWYQLSSALNNLQGGGWEVSTFWLRGMHRTGNATPHLPSSTPVILSLPECTLSTCSYPLPLGSTCRSQSRYDFSLLKVNYSMSGLSHHKEMHSFK